MWVVKFSFILIKRFIFSFRMPNYIIKYKDDGIISEVYLKKTYVEGTQIKVRYKQYGTFEAVVISVKGKD